MLLSKFKSDQKNLKKNCKEKEKKKNYLTGNK